MRVLEHVTPTATQDLRFLRSYPKDPWFSLLNAVLLEEQSVPILNVLGLTQPARAGFELRTSRMLSKSTTTRLPQPIREFDAWLIYCFTSRSRIFHLYGDVTTTGEGLQNLGLCSALRAFVLGGNFIVTHLLWHGTSVFRSHPKDGPI
jgi:hypothetical protein